MYKRQALNSASVRITLYMWTGIQVRTRYRMLLLGLIYGTLIYFVRGYTLDTVEILFQSFLFALVFHKLLVQRLMDLLVHVSYIARQNQDE